ncbi:MAG: EAL domain-containing protein [Lysobacteraceae bacterium]|jgi:diguanylate cyclase (GGDEF) domain
MPLPPLSPSLASIDEEDLRRRLAFLELGEEDQRRLIQLWEVVQGSRDRTIDSFYTHIGAFPEIGSFIEDWQTLQRLHQAQARYARELFTLPCDRAYVQNRLRIGAVHHHLGVEPHWYLASCAKLLTAIVDSMRPLRDHDPDFHADALKSLIRRLFLDMGLAMNAYVASDREALNASTASLRESQALLSEAHDLAQLARWELHLPSGALTCCTRAQELLHTEASVGCGGYDHLRRWVHPLDRPDVDEAFRAALGSDSAYDIRYRVEYPGQPPRMLRERGRALRDPAGSRTRVVGTIQDISLQVTQLSRIEQLALFDDLTKLPNRASFHAALERHIQDAAAAERVFAILFIDLDEFKEINDTKGHSVGDAVLIEVARRLRGNLQAGELVARLGGDEFVVLAAGADAPGARAIAARLAEAIARPMDVCGHRLAVRASIGISVFPSDGVGSELLVRNADIAMYAAKRSRTGIDVYHPRMSARLARRVQLADRLERAIRHDGLELYYQPQVSMADGTLVGAEALLRWNDAELGQVSPDEFVPLAEHRGLIGALGHWVVARACAQLREWEQRGLRLPGRLAINLSPRQFDDPDFADRLTGHVAACGLRPDRLDLELTESGLMADPDASLTVLATLRTAGFSLSLDDFGMGYSSLAHLRGFPLDSLKLDRSFVRGMLEHRHDYAIVVATMAMAQSLGLELVAEGVETRAQADALLELGCRRAQGFLFDAPLPAEAFARRWLLQPEPVEA